VNIFQRNVPSKTAVLTTTGNSDNTILASAFAGSPITSPGINGMSLSLYIKPILILLKEDATGLACMLESAIDIFNSGTHLLNRIKFVFYGGDGKVNYLQQLSQLNHADFRSIVAGVRFGTLGSPNYITSLDQCNLFDGKNETACEKLQGIFAEEMSKKNIPLGSVTPRIGVLTDEEAVIPTSKCFFRLF
jgi:hypothetical protein